MKSLTTLVFTLLLLGCGSGKTAFIKDNLSDFNTTETSKRFVESLKGKNYQLISHFDHEEVAKGIKEYLRPTLSIELNNPKISTKLMSCNPSMALELPIKVAIYRELNGKIHLSYTNPEYWSLKHNIKDKECIDLVMLIARDFSIATDSIKREK